jgi:hypothetical protein
MVTSGVPSVLAYRGTDRRHSRYDGAITVNRRAGGGAVPLSEHEQQLLNEIERALYEEDPKFAANVRGARLRGPLSRGRVQGLGLLVLGAAAIVVGFLVPVQPHGVPVISVIGFPILLAGAMVFWTSVHLRARAGPPEARAEQENVATRPRLRSTRGGGHMSLTQRMEERLRRRFEDGR